MKELVFKTKKEAVEYLRGRSDLQELSNGTFYYSYEYLLNYGEYERPDYKPVRYKDGWGIKIIYHYYQGIRNSPRCEFVRS